MQKPNSCCGLGTYACSIPMPIKGRLQGIDFCIADIVAALNASGLETAASCCGHKQIPGHVMLEDGREILIVNTPKERDMLIKHYKTLLKKGGDCDYKRTV